MKYIYPRLSLLLSLSLSFLGHLSATDIKVATFNIRRAGSEENEDRLWKNRKDAVLQAIKDLNADVIGLQEVTEEQLRDLKDNLNEDYTIFGEGRGHAFLGLSPSESVPILCKNNTFSDLEIRQETFWLNGQNGRFLINEKSKGQLPRICTMISLKTKSGDKLNIFNTHLDNKYPTARMYQAERILEKINHMQSDNNGASKIIVMGDFNAEWLPNIKGIRKETKSSYRLKEIIKDCSGMEQTLARKFFNSGFYNTRLEPNDNAQTQNPTENNNDTMRNEWKGTGIIAFLKKLFGKSDSISHTIVKTIDHILVSKTLTYTNHEHVQINLEKVSDHRPVKVTVSI